VSSSSKEPSIPIGNRLLARLPRDEYERLLPNLELVRFPRNRILYEAGDEVRSAYFLNDGLVSLLAITEAGQTVDLCTIGSEGVVGLPIILNVPIMPCRVVNQLPCEALLIKSAPLLAEFNRGGTLQSLLLKYAYGQLSCCTPPHQLLIFFTIVDELAWGEPLR
jgi:CRP-like cAMP-binding protein